MGKTNKPTLSLAPRGKRVAFFALGLGFHLPVGRIILHNTMLVELDLCLEPAALVLVRSVADARIGLPAGCDCHLRELDPGSGDLARLSRSQMETLDRKHVGRRSHVNVNIPCTSDTC